MCFAVSATKGGLKKKGRRALHCGGNNFYSGNQYFDRKGRYKYKRASGRFHGEWTMVRNVVNKNKV